MASTIASTAAPTADARAAAVADTHKFESCIERAIASSDSAGEASDEIDTSAGKKGKGKERAPSDTRDSSVSTLELPSFKLEIEERYSTFDGRNTFFAVGASSGGGKVRIMHIRVKPKNRREDAVIEDKEKEVVDDASFTTDDPEKVLFDKLTKCEMRSMMDGPGSSAWIDLMAPPKYQTSGADGNASVAAFQDHFQEILSFALRDRPRPPPFEQHHPLPVAPSFPSLFPSTVEPSCVVCQETIQGTVIRLECGHKYDGECLQQMFSSNVNDEYSFPPRCCGYVVPLDHVEKSLAPETCALYKAKMAEYSTAFRLYCSNPLCNAFLGPRSRRASPTKCDSCQTETCSKCTAAAHPRKQRCRLDRGLRRALKLGQSAGWQRCPTCRALVERNQGCFHMSCRCGTQFCYLCADDWRQCACSTRTPVMLVRLLVRVLKLRGNYLLDGEMPSAGSRGAEVVKRTAKKTWKGVVSAVNVVRAPLTRG